MLDPILVERHVANLPVAVHLVADGPDTDLEGLRTAVLRAHFAHARLHRAIAVFHFFSRLAGRAKSAVDGQIGLGSGQPAEGHEFMKAHVVRLHPIGPHHLQARRALIAIANTVSPVVSGDEVAAGPLEHLETLFLEEPDHPGVESLDVVGGHQRGGPDLKPAAASAQDLETRILCVGRRSELQRKFLVFARERRNLDGLRVAVACSPYQADHNLCAGIAGKIDSAYTGLAFAQAQFGLPDAARL